MTKTSYLGVFARILPKMVLSRASTDTFLVELTADKSDPSSKNTA